MFDYFLFYMSNSDSSQKIDGSLRLNLMELGQNPASISSQSGQYLCAKIQKIILVV